MKANISRQSRRPEQRYSAVGHLQGAMVTDADLLEGALTARQRVDDLGSDAIRSGVPKIGGAVTIDPDTLRPALQEGVIYADGVRGVLKAAADAAPDPDDPLGLFAAQADLPEGPALPDGDTGCLLYADLWQRPVFYLEDSYLADAGLHGAETTFRTRTMVQIKAVPWDADADPALVRQIEDGLGDFPKIGTALLSAEPRDPDAITDSCDPCATVVEAEQGVANALWRLEVVHVEGPPTAPTRLRLAWSAENAAAIAPADVEAEDFERAGRVYEYFSALTESYAGVFADWTVAHRSTFSDDLDAAPVPATAPDGEAWAFVRRWDGTALIDWAGSRVESSLGSGFSVAIDGSTVVLTVDAFTATLDLAGAAVVAGDYWLVELRSFAAGDDRIWPRDPTPPRGILHHTCALFRTGPGGDPVALDSDSHRKLSFPNLPDLPATHVSFQERCPTLFHGAETVQAALDALCDITAEDIRFTDRCDKNLYRGATDVQTALDNLCAITAEEITYTHDCDRLYGDATTVKGALDNLCPLHARQIDFDPGVCPDTYGDAATVQDAFGKLCQRDFPAERLLRLLFDWGVVCGVIPRLIAPDTGQIDITAGSLIDRTGRLLDYDGERVNLETLRPDQIHYPTPEELRAAVRKGTVCLALAVNEDSGKIEAHLVDQDRVYLPPDPGYEDLLARCDGIGDGFKVEKAIEKLRAEERQLAAWMVSVRTKDILKSAESLSVAEVQLATGVNERLLAAYAEGAGPEAEKRIRGRWQDLKDSLADGGAVGASATIRRMQLEIAKLDVLLWETGQGEEQCRCEALLPRCPPKLGPPPHFVPVACLKGLIGDEPILNWKLSSVCAFCCRKQALTWRTTRHFFGNALARMAATIADTCCSGEAQGKAAAAGTSPPGNTIADLGAYLQACEVLLGCASGDPTQFKTKVRVNDLATHAAEQALAGNGVTVAQVVDITEDAALAKLQQALAARSVTERLADDGTVRPGDAVALIVQDGIARDYLVVDRGQGKYLFPTTLEKKGADVVLAGAGAAGPAPVPDDARPLGDLTGQIETARQASAALSQDLEDLSKQRAELAAQVTDLKRELSMLVVTRSEADASLAESKAALERMVQTRQELATSIAGMAEQQAALRDGVSAASKELAELSRQREALIGSLRRSQPVAVLVPDDPELSKRLTTAGLATVGDVADLSDARVRLLEERRILTEADADTLRRGAFEFLNRR